MLLPHYSLNITIFIWVSFFQSTHESMKAPWKCVYKFIRKYTHNTAEQNKKKASRIENISDMMILKRKIYYSITSFVCDCVVTVPFFFSFRYIFHSRFGCCFCCWFCRSHSLHPANRTQLKRNIKCLIFTMKTPGNTHWILFYFISCWKHNFCSLLIEKLLSYLSQ